MNEVSGTIVVIAFIIMVFTIWLDIIRKSIKVARFIKARKRGRK